MDGSPEQPQYSPTNSEPRFEAVEEHVAELARAEEAAKQEAQAQEAAAVRSENEARLRAEREERERWVQAQREALESEIEQLRATDADYADKILTREREIKINSERRLKIANLREEFVAVSAKTAQDREFIAKAKAELADFPTDTQVLKLERRVESLKEQLKESERRIMQHRTGIEAYSARRSMLADHGNRLVSGTLSTVDAISQIIDAALQSEGKVSDDIVNAIAILSSVATAREAHCQALTQELQDQMKREKLSTDRILELQGLADLEVSKIDVRKDQEIAEITAEWGKEEAYLQSVYDRLFIINKEQQHHLQRGTHIKREPNRRNHIQEAALSKRSALVAGEINSSKSKLYDLEGDLSVMQQQLECLRAEGRTQLRSFLDTKAEAEQELARVRSERETLDLEGNNLRNLKAELQQTLSTTREHSVATPITPRRSGNLTPRISAPKA